MSDDEVQQLREDMNAGFEALGKRLGFLERTVYTLVGGITVIAFFTSTGHLQLGG
jgi:hypothetical protein